MTDTQHVTYLPRLLAALLICRVCGSKRGTYFYNNELLCGNCVRWATIYGYEGEPIRW